MMAADSKLESDRRRNNRCDMSAHDGGYPYPNSCNEGQRCEETQHTIMLMNIVGRYMP